MLRAGTVGGTSRLFLPYLFHSHPSRDAECLLCCQSCWFAGSAEMVHEHDGLFPLIDLKEHKRLPIGREGGLDDTLFEGAAHTATKTYASNIHVGTSPELGPSDCVKLFCDLSCEHWDCHFGKCSSDKGHAESAQQWAWPRILGLLVQLLHAAVRLGLSVTSNRHESTRSFGHMDRVYRYRWSGQIRVP